MLYLKKIHIQGFKSFPDKTTIELENGITCIVGPNGSGKSNISDAVMWTLGEQSAKTLRGTKMEDVIFAGTQSRKPVGFAEVTLVFDNTDRRIASDSDEVHITRKAYRSGDNEYCINKKSCRLKDIYELFLDTGIGREGYSIVGQGKIDNILSTKPDERRQVFEEAAGISKFRYKKEDAEKKLVKTEENLIRLEDIINELEGQIEPLNRQQKKAKKYLKYKDELKNLEVSAYIMQIDELKKTEGENNKGFTEAQNLVLSVKNKISDNDNEISRLLKLQSELEEEISGLREKLQGEIDKSSVNTHEIELCNKEIEFKKLTLLSAKSQIQETENNIKKLKEELIKINSSEELILSMRQKSEEKSRKLEESLLEAQNSVIAASTEIDNLKGEHLDLLQDISSLELKINNTGTAKGNYKQRQTVVEAELSENSKKLAELKDNKKAEEEKLALHNKAEEEHKKEVSVINEKLSKHNKELAELNFKKQGVLKELSLISSRISVLSELENELEGLSKSVKGVLSAHKKNELKNISIYGTLSSLIEVSPKYALALEIAMGGALQNIVTETKEDAKHAIEYLKNNRLGRATFLPVSAVKGNELPEKDFSGYKGFLGIASTLVSADEKYCGIIKHILGRVLVADTIDNAISISEKTKNTYKIVTLEGDILNPGGSMSGGSHNKSNGLLTRKAQIKEFADKKDVILKELSSLEAFEKELALKAEELNGGLSSLNTALNEVANRKVALLSDIGHFNLLIDSCEKLLANLNNEKTVIETRLKEASAEDKKYIAEIEEKNKEITLLKAKIAEKEQQARILTEKSNEIAGEISSNKITVSSYDKDLEHILSDKAVCSERIAEQEARTFNFGLQTEAVDKEIASLLNQIEEKRKLIEEAKIIIKNMGEEIEGRNNDKNKFALELENQQSKSKELINDMFLAQEKLAEAESNKNKSEIELENVYARLWEDYELTYSAAKELCPEAADFEGSKKKIAEIKSIIKNLGNINIDSIEDYKNVKTRYDFLKAQQEDLEKSKASLTTIINDMTKSMKIVFSENFEKISKKFSVIFTEPFGGGKAQLVLSNPDDVLKSPIEINVQPPGKKLQSITLLSGGEKAFTAIAILFSIFSVKPAPFCILDEIEAALDEENVYKFASYIKRFRGFQFMIVTHRQGTMESAETLYGVTMQEKGVSKLLPLSFSDIKNLKSEA